MSFLTRSRSCALVLGIAAAAAVAVPASASASADVSPVIGHVYVNDNTKGTNTIGAFDRHADGSLTPVAGSPFVAGGAGTGSGLASQGAIQITQDGRFLIAVDAGSSQVSVLRIHFDGSLSLVRHSVVSSGGTLPERARSTSGRSASFESSDCCAKTRCRTSPPKSSWKICSFLERN